MSIAFLAYGLYCYFILVLLCVTVCYCASYFDVLLLSDYFMHYAACGHWCKVMLHTWEIYCNVQLITIPHYDMLLGAISTDLSTSTIFNRYAIEFAPKTGLQYAFVGNLYDSKIFTITDMQLNLLLKLVYSMLLWAICMIQKYSLLPICNWICC